MRRIPLPLYIAVLTAGIFAGLPVTYAQEKIVFLKPLTCIPHASFSRVVVWDDRPDTTIIRFNTTASRAIAHCIQAAVGPDPERNRTILIDIKQLAVVPASQGRRKLLFSADIYEKKDDSLWLKISSYSRSRLVDFSIASAMDRLFSGVIGAIDVGLTVTKDTGAIVLRRGQGAGAGEQTSGAGGIAATPRIDYPIFNRREVAAAGCYRSFYDFRNDSLVRCPYGMKLVMDSLYTLLVNDLPAKAADDLVDDIWAYADTAGRLYIRILGNRFVALTGKDDGFSFYLPRALPDMYSIQRMKDRINNFDPTALNQQVTVADGNLLAIPLGIVMALTIDATLNGSAALINQAKVKKIERAGIKSGNFRDCRLNMENGEIEY